MDNIDLVEKYSIEYKKGFSRPLILYVLNIVGQTYPFGLITKIKELTKGNIIITGSNIYPMITKLEEEMLIEIAEGNSKRKEYKLTEKGKMFLDQLDRNIKEFCSILSNLKDN